VKVSTGRAFDVSVVLTVVPMRLVVCVEVRGDRTAVSVSSTFRPPTPRPVNMPPT
jgi:hypothetical protein